jgi:hypothetical protein
MKSFLLQATTVWQAICLVAGALPGGRLHASMLGLDEYLQRAHASRRRGDRQSVARQMAQAVNHPDLPKTGDTRVKVLVVMDVRPRIPSRQPTRSEPRTIPVETNPHNNEPFAIRVESPVPPTSTGQD